MDNPGQSEYAPTKSQENLSLIGEKGRIGIESNHNKRRYTDVSLKS